MKNFMSLALMGLCTFMCMACKNHSAQPQNDKSANVEAVEKKPQTAADVKTRVETIYKDVCDAYNSANQMEFGEGMKMLQDKKFDEAFCSEAWNKKLAEVVEKDNQHPDEMGFFDYDYWVMGQDFENLAVTDVKVVSFENDKAVVSLNLHNMGNTNPIKLKMVYERGDWFIDDFITSYEGVENSVRADMDEYLAS